jgi:hypothetical protein
MNKKKRYTIRARSKFKCEYCLCPEDFSSSPFESDHIIAVGVGGDDDLLNFANACSGCNGYKSKTIEAFDPISGQVVPLYNPRTDVWEDHFSWDETFTILIGLSPVGRVTIAKLKLNRPAVVKIRKILHRFGEHP